MSNLQLKGSIVNILNTVSGTSRAGKEWNKQDFVIQTEGEYPDIVCFTLFGEKTSILQNIKLGDKVTVFFNLRSNEFEGRYFTNVNCWKIDKEENVDHNYQPAPEQPAPEPPQSGDLPF